MNAIANENVVVLSCDAGYLPYALCVAQQIAVAHPRRNFDITVFCSDDVTLPATLADGGVRLQQLDGDNPFSHGPFASRHGSATYLRLLLPARVLGRYRRMLYLDSDIVLNRPGLERLFSVDLCGAAVGAVRDNQQWRTPGRRVKEFETLGLPASAYFNAGLLLMDVERFVRHGVLEACLQRFAEQPHALFRHDQSLLNLVLKDRWTELSPVWNWQYTWSSRFFADLADPHLIHFIGPRKPWKDVAHELPARFRSAYATFLAQHFPDAEGVNLGESPIGWPHALPRSFLKHALATGPMKRYLDRFETDTVTHGGTHTLMHEPSDRRA